MAQALFNPPNHYDQLNRVSALWGGPGRIDSFVYDVNDRIPTKQVSYDSGKSIAELYQYSYNATNQLATVFGRYFLHGQTISYYTENYQYPSSTTHNYSHVNRQDSSLISGLSAGGYDYTWDNRNSPSAYLAHSDPALPTHNVTQMKTVGYSYGYTVNYRYTYDSKDYPVTVNVTQSNGNPYTITCTYVGCK